MNETNFGEFDDILEMTAESLRPVAERLHSLLRTIDPETCIVVRLGDRAATYGVGPKKMSEGYCYIMPHKNWINLGFFKGVDLSDPADCLEGTGAKMRHVKIRSLAECEDPKIEALIRAAVAERKSALGRA